MKLCKFTKAVGDGEAVYVNPMHVVEIASYEPRTTWITTTASGEKPYRVVVKESVAAVAQAISDELASLT